MPHTKIVYTLPDKESRKKILADEKRYGSAIGTDGKVRKLSTEIEVPDSGEAMTATDAAHVAEGRTLDEQGRVRAAVRVKLGIKGTATSEKSVETMALTDFSG